MQKQLTNNINFRQSNNFIESRFSDFTLLELKAIEFLASQTKRTDIQYINDKRDKIIDVRLIDLARILNVNTDRMYQDIDNIVRNLFKKQAEFKFINENGRKVHRLTYFVNNIDYIDGVFYFRVNYEVLNYFVDIKKDYTNINLKYITAVDSIYAVKMYKLLKQYQSIKKRDFTIDELKDQLGIVESYRKYSDFKRKVIEVFVTKINENTDINVDYVECKVGKAVKSLSFQIN